MASLALSDRKIRKPVDAGIIAICLSFLLGALLLFRPEAHGVDPIAYYSWLRAAVIEHTLDVGSTWQHYYNEPLSREPDFTMKTATGYSYNHWAAGPAILWSPLYLMAHLFVLADNASGGSMPADGYSFPYLFAASISTVLYALLGVILLYRIAMRYFQPAIAAGSAIVVVFATPLVFYTFSNPLMSHALDAFAGIVYVFAWLRARDKPGAGRRMAVGMAIGLAMWIRVQNALLVAVPALEVLSALLEHGNLRQRFKELLKRGVPLGIGLALLVVPLMAFWKVMYGAWIVNTYSASQGTFINLASPHLLEVLFSSNRGLFTWSPVLLPAVAGTIPLWRIDRRLTLLLIAGFLLNYYLVASLSFWSGGAAFGARFFINSTAYFGLGLAAAADWLHRRVSLRAMTIAGGVFVCWNLLLLVQYALNWVPHGGDVDLLMMAKNQFLVIPANLQRVINILISRSAH